MRRRIAGDGVTPAAAPERIDELLLEFLGWRSAQALPRGGGLG